MTDRERTPLPNDALWHVMARTPPSERIDPSQKMADLYGTGRGGRPDTKATAEGLGVSQRTVQRWLSKGMPQRSTAADTLNGRHQQWQQSPGGRVGQISPRREARLRRQGTTIQYAGMVKISSDRRKWSGSVALTGDQASAILDAQLAGDDRAAHRALEDAFEPAFGGHTSLSLTPHSLSTFK